MFNLEGLIPKLCQLAQEVGDDDRILRLRSAGLQALAFMVNSTYSSCVHVDLMTNHKSMTSINAFFY